MTAAKPLVMPFRGERYARPLLDAVLAPPYDVISPDARKTLAARDPHNIVHLILPEAPVNMLRWYGLQWLQNKS